MLFAAAFSGLGMSPILHAIIPCESAPRGMAGTSVGLVTCVGEFAGVAFAIPLLASFGTRFGPCVLLKVGAFLLVPMCFLSFFLKETSPSHTLAEFSPPAGLASHLWF